MSNGLDEMRHPIGIEIFAHSNRYPESHDLQLPRTHPSEIFSAREK